jgi:predicted MFS family arabinose efflux permease
VASAFGLVYSSALVLDRIGRGGRPGLSAVHFAGVGTGIAVSAMVVFLSGGWRTAWLAAGLTSLVAVGIVAALIPDRGDVTATAPSAPGRTASPLATLVLAYGLFGFGYIITATFLVALVRASPQVRALEAFVWLLVGLTAAPSVGVWTAVEGRVGMSRSFALACVLEAVGVTASALWVRPTGILLAAALLGATFMGITALGLTWARRIAPGDPRSTLAMMTAAFGFGQIVGPAFAGMVYDATGTLVVPSLAAAGALLAGATLAITRSE